MFGEREGMKTLDLLNWRCLLCTGVENSAEYVSLGSEKRLKQEFQIGESLGYRRHSKQ